MPVEITKNFRRKRLMSPKKCAPGSFRFKKIGKGRGLIVCCPRGNYRHGKCAVGTKAQALLTPRR